MRQRRGVLLGALATRGRVRIADDPDAAASLVGDGLARAGRTYLLPVGEPAAARYNSRS